MSMIDPKGSTNRDRLPVDKMLHDAIVDVEDGVEFWKTLARIATRNGDLPPSF